MALVKQTTSSLINGVSQQPDIQRLESQCEEQLNGMSDVLDGVGPRPSSDVISQITGLDTSYGRVKTAVITDADGEDHIVVLDGDGSVRIFDTDGNEHTVTYDPGASEYVTVAGNPAESITVAAAGSRLFLLNRDAEVEYTDKVAGELSEVGIIWVRQAEERRKYEICFEGAELPSNVSTLAFPPTERTAVPNGPASQDPLTPQYQGEGDLAGQFTITGASMNQFRGMGYTSAEVDLGNNNVEEIKKNSSPFVTIERNASGLQGAAVSVSPDDIAPVLAQAFNSQANYIVKEFANPEGVARPPGSQFNSREDSDRWLFYWDEPSNDPGGLYGWPSNPTTAANHGMPYPWLTPAPKVPGTNQENYGAYINVWMGGWRAEYTGANGVIIIYPRSTESYNDFEDPDYWDPWPAYTNSNPPSSSSNAFGTGLWCGVAKFTSETFGKARFIAASDSANYAISHRECSTLDDLPLDGAPDGFKIKVTGAADSDLDDFWVTYKDGGWEETAAPGTSIELDGTTMPQVLEKTGATEWKLGPADWSEREAGNEENTPGPSFIGKKIVDIASHKNRLVLATDDSFVFSKQGDFLSFFQQSARDLLDSDPIDVEVSTSSAERGVGVFSMASMDQKLIGFGRTAQTVLSASEDAFTPSSVGADVTSYYDIDVDTRPVVLGNRAYFVADTTDNNASLMEYGAASATAFIAQEITSSIPNYIPRDLDVLTGSLDENSLIVASQQEPSTLYVYRQYYAGREKAMASWSKWTFQEGMKVLSAKYRADDLYLIMEHPGSWFKDGQPRVYLEKISMESRWPKLRIDHAIEYDASTLTSFYDEGSDQTRYRIDGPLPDTGRVIVITQGPGTNLVKKDNELFVDGSGDRWVWIPGPADPSTKFKIGSLVPFRYKPSKLYYRRQTQTGVVPVTTGRLQVKRMRVSVKDAGPMRVEVSPEGRPNFYREFTPQVVSIDPTGDVPVKEFETYEFDIGCDARTTDITFINDDVTPGTLVSFEWVSNYFDRWTGRPRGQ